MSRRSSTTSLTTSGSCSTTTDDPLMRDCYDLRQRLLQTEQSIKSLNPPFVYPANRSNSIPQSELSGHPPTLTLADLSPATTDRSFDLHERLNSSYLQSSIQPFRSSSSDPSGLKDQQFSPNENLIQVDQHSTASNEEYGDQSLSKKLFKLREKNTSLVSQNNKLMCQLETMGLELHQQCNKVKMLALDLEKERENVRNCEDSIVALEKKISSQQDALKCAEDKLLYSTEQVHNINKELSEALQSSKNLQRKYQEELKIRKHLQSQLQETLKNVDQLTSKMTEDKQRGEEQDKLRCERVEKLEEEVNELRTARNELRSQNTTLQGQLAEMKQEIKLLQSEGVVGEEYRSSLERDNADLRSTVARQRQRVARLEKQSPSNEETIQLHQVVMIQNEKIRYYQQEVERNKQDMLRLENLVQRVQEQNLRRELFHTPSTMDSGISRSTAKSSTQLDKVKGVAGEDVGTMSGLRSELSFIAERNRINDRKQQELEQIISKMEDEAASYSAQLIQLEEKLAEKNAINASLEGKVNQQNLRVVDIKADLEHAMTNNSELQRQIHCKSLDIEELQKQLNEKIIGLDSHAKRVDEMEQRIEQNEGDMRALKTSLQAKEREVAEHRNLLEKTRGLHVDQCRELERQIEQLQSEYENKNNQVSHLDAVIKACRQDAVVKSARVLELEKALDEHQRELGHLKEQSNSYEETLAALQEKARLESERGVKLDQALIECRQEIETHVQHLVDTKRHHEQEMKEKTAEITKLKDLIKRSKGDYRKQCEEKEHLERTVRERNDVVKLQQERISEVGNSQARLEQQIGILELELRRERQTNEEEVKKLQCLLETARQDLDERTRQLNELNTSLVSVHKDLKQSSSHVVDLEQLLQQTRDLLDRKCEEAHGLTDELRETKAELSRNGDKSRELEKKLAQTENQLIARDEQVVSLDCELDKTQREVEGAVEQLKELKNVLENNKKELKEKEEKMNELDKELNESQELLQKKNQEICEKDARVSELDHTVMEYQWKLKERVTEMNKLDVSIKEQRSDLKQKANALEHALSQYQYELSQKTLEGSELKSKCAQVQEQLKQKSVRLEYMEKTMKQQQEELRKRTDQVSEFEKEFTKLKVASDNNSEMTQELRLAREKIQHTHSEMLDTRRKLLKLEQREHELVEELDQVHVLLASKEADCTRLAKELGSAQVREAQAEARCVQEVRRVEQQYSLKIADCDAEIQRLRETHNKLFAQKEEEAAAHRLNIQGLREKENVTKKEIQRLNDEQWSCSGHIQHLEQQLKQMQEQAHAANETIVIKESEITRLQAKVSGYERATFGSRLNFDSRDSRPSSAGHTNLPRSFQVPDSKTSIPSCHSRTPVKRSSSAHDLHEMSASLISFGSSLREQARPDESETLAASHLLLGKVIPSVNKTDGNTFERLFDMARQELNASEKNEDGMSRAPPRASLRDINPTDADRDHIQ